MVNTISVSRVASLRAILISIALGGMLVPLNSSMIAIALPDVMRQFGASVDAAGWLITAYLLTMAMVQLIAGQLGDQFGRRKLLLGGLGYFGLASLFAALSPSLPILIFFRVQQAVAGAMIITNVIALAFQVVPAEQRNSNLGLLNAVIILAAAGGPPIGGLLVGIAGWQSIFWVNLPPVIIAFILGWFSIPNIAARTTQSRDSKSLPRLRIVHRQAFISANVAIALCNLAMYVTLLAVPLLLSIRAGWTSAQTGMILAAMSVTMALFSPLGGRWADRLGRQLPILVGLAIVTVTLFPLAWLGAEISIALLIVCLAGGGIGMGLASSALQTSALESVAAEQTGIAAGIASTSRYLGSIVGSGMFMALPDIAQTGNFQSLFLIIVWAAFGATIISLGIHDSPSQKDSSVRYREIA